MSLTDEAGTVERLERARGKLVMVEQAGSRATVTLNDPVSRNTLSQPLTATLHRALQQLVDVAELRAIVLTGVEDAFSSGAERQDAAARWPEEPAKESSRVVRCELGEIARLIARSEVPFVAAINGVAAGAALALALTCDVVTVSHQARLAPAAGRVGLLSEVGMSWLLVRRLGYHRTFSLFTGGNDLSTAEAFRAGLVDAVVEHDELAFATSFWCEIAALAATRDKTRQLVRSATESSRGRPAVMGEFATNVSWHFV
jgi:2-(1,2-epoxy-1,2-dihydrophenyl)acetyl-CoA isomerase